MKILEFIKQNCKNVEFHALGDVCDFLKTGTLSKDKLIENGEFPVRNSAREHYGYYDKFNNEGDTICVSSRGEYAGFAYYIDEKFWAGGLCYPFRSKDIKFLNTKFVYYFYKANENNIMNKLVSRSAIPALNKSDLQNFKIPVPSLEVQNKIVEVLDSFSSLVRSLVRSLVLEKTAREKQYKYYLNHLITNARNSRIYKLGEVGEVTKLAGFEFTKYVKYSDNGKIIALRGLNVKNGILDLSKVKYIDESDFTKLNRSKLYLNDMLFTYVGTIGQIALIDKNDKYYLAPNVARIRFTSNEILPKFVLYYFQSSFFKDCELSKYLNKSSMENLTMSNIRKFEIPLPPLDEQERIVKILDSLNELANGFSAGIPKEIELRQKQYGYWRDRLLDF